MNYHLVRPVAAYELSYRDYIREIGGHIGVGIRSSFRGRGLCTLLLGLTIAEARQRGLTPIHIHCHKHNTASARMIVGNGGVLQSEVAEPGSTQIVQRYIVEEAA